jgi:hypothetical protein
MILLGHAPTSDISVEIVFQCLRGGDQLDRAPVISGSSISVFSSARLANQRGVMVKAKSRQLPTEILVVLSRHKLERRLDVMLGVPARQRFDVMFVAGAKPDDPTEGRQAGHQGNSALVKPSISDTDWVARETLEHFHAGNGIGNIRRQRPLEDID